MWVFRKTTSLLFQWANYLLLWSCACIVLAQDEPVDYVSGKVKFSPMVDVRVIYDDNIYLQESSPKSSIVSEVNSHMKVTLDNHINQTTVGYSGNYAYVQSSNNDSHLDHMIFAKLHHEIMRNLTFDVGTAYQLGHEKRGAFYTVSSTSSLNEPDKFNVTQVNGLFTLGTRQSKGRLEVFGMRKELSFSTRPNVTANRNNQITKGGATFIRTISPKTSFVLEGTVSSIDYVSESPSTATRDSLDQAYLIGWRWEFTQLSKGEANVGFRLRNFDTSSRSSVTGLNWRLGLNWTPLRSIDVNFKSAARFDESTGNSDFINTREAGVAFRYLASQRHSIGASLLGAYKTYPPTDDYDYQVTAEVNTDFRVSKWLGIGVAYKQIRQTSSRTGFNYTNDSVYVHLAVTM